VLFPTFSVLYGSSSFEIVVVAGDSKYFNQRFFFLNCMHFSLNQGTSGTNEEQEVRRNAMKHNVYSKLYFLTLSFINLEWGNTRSPFQCAGVSWLTDFGWKLSPDSSEAPYLLCPLTFSMPITAGSVIMPLVNSLIFCEGGHAVKSRQLLTSSHRNKLRNWAAWLCDTPSEISEST